MLEQSIVDGGHRGRIQGAAEVYSVDAGADVGTELDYAQRGHLVTIGDRGSQHHGCAHRERKEAKVSRSG
ncbi:hypothetical protein MFTT_46750 [Mycolicibacterium fortuitum subsp. fortuitum]|nr:hypothetical protein MFTT_46750 [Mycolicibacterium fortuitum subsp. fortuitum]